MQNILKAWPISLVLSVLSYADTSEPSIEMISEKNVQNQPQPISAVHGVEKGFFINGSFLYWKADMDNLEYALHIKVANANGGSGTITADAKVQELDFEWNPGGRLEIGYIFNQREGWKAALSGTHFNSEAHGSSRISNSNNGQEELVPRWFPPISGQFLTRSSAHWELEFNTLDLTLGRDFFVSKWISFSPYFGLQGAWIKQDYKINNDAFYIEQAGLVFRENQLRFHQHFKGFGFEMGTGFIFHIVDNFGIIGNVEGSLVWGVCKTFQRLNGGVPIETLGVLSEDIRVHDSKHRLRASIASDLGFIWEQFWNKQKNRFFLSATYAYSIWFNQNEFRNLFFGGNAVNVPQPLQNNSPIFEKNEGDLQLQGLVISAGLDF